MEYTISRHFTANKKMLKSTTKVMSCIKLKLEINKMFYFAIVLAFKVL